VASLHADVILLFYENEKIDHYMVQIPSDGHS